MQAQSSGPLTTFLMFIPLVAVPCLAVFGVPDLDTFSAASAEEDADSQSLKDLNFGRASEEPRDLLRGGATSDPQSADRLSASANGMPSRREGASDRVAPGLFDADDMSPRASARDDGDFPLESRSNEGITFAAGDDRDPPRDASPNDDSDSSARTSRSRQNDDWPAPDHIRNDWQPDRSPREGAARDRSDRDDRHDRHGLHEQATARGSDADEIARAFADAESSGTHRQRDLHETSASKRLSSSDGVDLGEPTGAGEVGSLNPFDAGEAIGAGERADDADELDPDSPFATVNIDDDVAKARQAAAPSSAGGRTWQTAVQRLKALGIHQYQLSPGVHENEVHFSCMLETEDGGRVVRRFEAEAGDPLAAVDDVLTQIRQWQHKR